MSLFQTILRLWTLKQQFSLTWAEALNEGIQGLQEYAAIDRRYEQEREAQRMVAQSIGDTLQHHPEDVEMVPSIHSN